MYFDCVIDDQFAPVYNSTPQEVKEWLTTTPDVDHLRVVYGHSLRTVSVPEYLEMTPVTTKN